MSATQPHDASTDDLDQLRTTTATILNTDDELLSDAQDAGHKKRHEEVETTDPNTSDYEKTAQQINETVRWEIERSLLEGVKDNDEIPSELHGEAYDVVRDEVNDCANRIMDDVIIGASVLAETLAERAAREPARDPDAEYERWREQEYGR